MRGGILPVEETGDAKHPVPVRASGIAAKCLGDQLEHLFLTLEVEAGTRQSAGTYPAKSR